ncbi:glycine zipper domain-containing protein [Acidiphilium sp.]|uniref:glycine zipper domain-containing protein n=1 Tax=Acidiphilium sp. TaxID=527 RepID=UPI003CFD17F6
MSWSGKRKDAMGTLSDEFDRFQDDFDTLRTKLVRMANDTVKDFSDSPQKLAELKSAIDLRLSTIEDEIGDLGKQLRIKGGKAADRVERRVHEQPFAALAVAAGVGFIAAYLLRRRHST